jgi:mannose PTS system EIIA component
LINFIVITHGEFGAYLVEAAESIAGRQMQGVRSIALSPRLAATEIKERIKNAVTQLSNPDGLIVFTDMPGGTPSNLAFPIIKDQPRVEMVSGVNLTMLVSAFSYRSRLPLEELLAKVQTDAQRSMRDIRQMFLSRAR